MQGDFEKKVQQKMDELRLTPSAPVWEKIELEIGPPKRRRRGLFWIPFIIVLLGAVSWWMLDVQKQQSASYLPSTADNKQSSTPEANTTPTETTTIKDTETTEKETATGEPGTSDENHKPVSATETSIAITEHGTNSSKVEERFTSNEKQPVAETGLRKRNILIDERKTAAIEHQPITVDKHAAEIETVIDTRTHKETTTTQPVKEEPTAVIPNENTETIKAIDSTANTNQTTGQTTRAATAQPLAHDSANTKRDTVKTKIASASKWKKSVMIRAGWSGSSGSSYLFSSNRDSYSSPVPNSNTGAAMLMESPVSTGISYAGSFGLTRTVGKRWELSFGLQYAYYSTRQQVGAYQSKDTALSFAAKTVSIEGFYRNGRQTRYTNRYHVIEVPFSVRFQPMLNLPLKISAGASYGRLLQSNALTYNMHGNFYYQNPANVTKNFGALFSTVTYRLLKGTSWNLEAGPFVQYQFPQLQTENTQSTRLFTSGLKAAIYF